MPFVHLHNHSEYSLLDGATKINAMVKKAKNDNQEYVALTDHGNMFGTIDFYKACVKNGIKPIIGFEAYLVPDRFDKTSKGNFHLTLLAKNNTGYQNLLKLSTFSYVEGFYYKPRIDKQLLRHYSDGIMAGSACLHGEINYYLLNGNYDLAKKAGIEYQEIFGKDNFFIEIMRHDLPEQLQIEPLLLKLANEINAPIVATNDCHYLEKDDAKAQDALLCIQMNKLISDTNRMRMRTQEFYFKTQEEMYDKFKDLKEAVDNSYLIANKSNIEIPIGQLVFPIYLKDFNTDDQKLKELIDEGFIKRFGSINNSSLTDEQYKIYKQRLDYEFSVIKQMHFSGYFLIVWDFINYAKSKGIPVGPGRGSAAGSLVSYCLGITDIEPMKHDLLFERFLNPDRISMPDIDVDFCIERRDEVIKYVLKKYGFFNVAQVGTFGTLGARNVLKDVGRSMGIAFEETNKITKYIPDSNSTINEVESSNPEFKKIVDSNKELFTLSKTLEGCKRHFSTHAAGIVISREPIYKLCPLYKSDALSNTGILVTQFEKEILEDIGLIKFDFLGLKNLTVIDNALKMIEKDTGIVIDWQNVDFNDENVYQMLSDGHVAGVFQLESSGMQGVLKELKPTCFKDLVAVLALYRPGPLGSGMVKDFIERKHGRQQVEYFLPQLEPILKDTYGVIVYQEQVMQIANVLAGYTMSEADVLRKIMGKKQIEKLGHERIKFLERCKEKNVDTAKAEEIFNLMEKFAEYGFNKSHSTAYAYISFQTAYLKYYYPEYFMCALMNGDIGDFEQTQKYIEECADMGIDVLPPDINLSEDKHSIANAGQDAHKAIRFGFSSIKNLGDAAIQEILSVKSLLNNHIQNVNDFFDKANKTKINSKVAESLIKAGVFDLFDKNRKKLLLNVKIDFYSKSKKSKKSQTLYPDKEPVVVTTQKDIMDYENEVLGISLTVNYTHLLKQYEILSFYNIDNIAKTLPDKNIKNLLGIVCNIEARESKNGKKIFKVYLINYSGIFEIAVFDISDIEIILKKSFLSYTKNGNDIDFSTINFFSSHPVRIPCKVKNFNGAESYSFGQYIGNIDNWVEIKNELKKFKNLNIKIIYNKLTEFDYVTEFMYNLKSLIDSQNNHNNNNANKNSVSREYFTLKARLYIEYKAIDQAQTENYYRHFRTNTFVDINTEILSDIKKLGSKLSNFTVMASN